MYLRLVDWGRKAHGPQDLPQYNALLGLATLATMNLFSVAMVSEWAVGSRDLIRNPRVSAVVVWLAFLGLHYITLAGDTRRSQIDALVEPHEATWTVWLYPSVSFIAFVALLVLRAAST